MRITNLILMFCFLVIPLYAADEIIVPVAKVDLLKLNDKAKTAATQQKGIIGTAVGYVKGGIIYLWDSSVSGIKATSEKVVEHPYISLSTIIAALMVDKNNNITGLWNDGKGKDTVTEKDGKGNTYNITVDGDDNEIRIEVK